MNPTAPIDYRVRGVASAIAWLVRKVGPVVRTGGYIVHHHVNHVAKKISTLF